MRFPEMFRNELSTVSKFDLMNATIHRKTEIPWKCIISRFKDILAPLAKNVFTVILVLGH